MPPAEQGLSLLQLHALLSSALSQRDWARVERIDLAIRGSLKTLGPPEALAAEDRVARQQLEQLHATALQASLREGARLRELLDCHLERAEGLSAYRSIDLYRDEE